MATLKLSVEKNKVALNWAHEFFLKHCQQFFLGLLIAILQYKMGVPQFIFEISAEERQNIGYTWRAIMLPW